MGQQVEISPRQTAALAEAAECGPQFAAALLKRLLERHPVLCAAGAGADGEGPPNPFGGGLISAAEMPAAEPPLPLWYGLYPGLVTLLVGATGAGKSSLLYGVALALARREELYEQETALPPGATVLYIDPENAGDYRGAQMAGLCGRRLERIGGRMPAELLFHDGRAVDLCRVEQRAALAALMRERRVAVLIVDPIIRLMMTRDENDNAEANRQMSALAELARDTGAAILATHHLGKSEEGDYGRGASARLAAADVGLTLRAKGSADEDDAYTGQTIQRSDICRFAIAKDRPGWFGRSSLYLRMAGDDRFALASAEDWRAEAKSGGAAKQAEGEVIRVLADGRGRNQREILSTLSAAGYGRRAAEAALDALARAGRITTSTGPRRAVIYTAAECVRTPYIRDVRTHSDPAAKNGHQPEQEIRI